MWRSGREAGSWLVREESRWTQVEHEWAVWTCRKTANHVPGCISKSVVSRLWEVIMMITLCLAFVQDYCIQFGASPVQERHGHTRENSMEGNWNVEWAGAHSVRAEAEYTRLVLFWEEKAGEIGDIFTAAFSYLMSKYKEVGARLFLQLNCEGMRGKGHKQQYRKFQLDIRIYFSAIRVFKSWSRWPKEVVVSSSVEVFIIQLNNLLWVHPALSTVLDQMTSRGLLQII